MQLEKDLIQLDKSEDLLDILKNIYLGRKKLNRNYSLTSFARDLGISKSVLSRILSNERNVSVKLCIHLTTVLNFEENQAKRILLKVVQSQTKNAKVSKKFKDQLEKEVLRKGKISNRPTYSIVEIEQFKAMASWQHLAIINLIDLKTFKNSPAWIAKRLGISIIEARDALDRLIGLGLILESEGILKRSKKNFFIQTTKSEIAIRNFHEQMIQKAIDELKETTQKRFEQRLINGITFTCSEEQIHIIKQKIDQLQDEILELTSNSEAENLYQLNMQFFSLLKNEQRGE
ncbi:MAG: TIGR02147 family protein [Bacteriovoracaceae bacterium]